MTSLGPSLRRRRRAARPWLRFAAALGLSLLVNAVAFRLALDSGIIGPLSPAGPPRAVSLSPLSAQQWAKNRAVDPRQQPSTRAAPLVVTPAPPPPPPKKEDDKLSGQVVDVAPSKNSTRPKDSKYLAEHDSTVEKETKSRHQRPGYENPMATPAGPNAGQAVTLLERERERERVRSGDAGREGVAKPGARPQPAPRAPPAVAEQAPRERLALKLDREGTLRLRAPRLGVSPSPGASGAESSPPDLPEGEEGPQALPGKPGPRSALQLMPSAQDYERIFGGPAPDKLDGVEEGEGTFLNTRSFKYAGYYNRISRALQQKWDPGSAMRARDPRGERFPPKEWNTGLVVKLDEQGAVKQVTVARSSGLEFLDNEAVQAFWRAQPFVNPPPGLVDQHREIVLAWGFSLDTTGPRLMELLRFGVPRPSE